MILYTIVPKNALYTTHSAPLFRTTASDVHNTTRIIVHGLSRLVFVMRRHFIFSGPSDTDFYENTQPPSDNSTMVTPNPTFSTERRFLRYEIRG